MLFSVFSVLSVVKYSVCGHPEGTRELAHLSQFLNDLTSYIFWHVSNSGFNSSTGQTVAGSLFCVIRIVMHFQEQRISPRLRLPPAPEAVHTRADRP